MLTYFQSFKYEWFTSVSSTFLHKIYTSISSTFLSLYIYIYYIHYSFHINSMSKAQSNYGKFQQSYKPDKGTISKMFKYIHEYKQRTVFVLLSKSRLFCRNFITTYATASGIFIYQTFEKYIPYVFASEWSMQSIYNA